MNSNIIIQRIKKGLPVIVVDDKHREDEGDIFFSAQKITISWMAFTVRHTSGIVCAPLTQARARELRLRPLMSRPTNRHGCKFLMPVDVHHGAPSGVSAHDRVLTLRRLVHPQAKPGDFGRPGHVFPLLAHQKLLRGRRGHTEAAITLLTIAHMPLVGVIAELMHDNGTMMRSASLKRFAQKFSIPVVQIEEIG